MIRSLKQNKCLGLRAKLEAYCPGYVLLIFFFIAPLNLLAVPAGISVAQLTKKHELPLREFFAEIIAGQQKLRHHVAQKSEKTVGIPLNELTAFPSIAVSTFIRTAQDNLNKITPAFLMEDRLLNEPPSSYAAVEAIKDLPFLFSDQLRQDTDPVKAVGTKQKRVKYKSMRREKAPVKATNQVAAQPVNLVIDELISPKEDMQFVLASDDLRIDIKETKPALAPSANKANAAAGLEASLEIAIEPNRITVIPEKIALALDQKWIDVTITNLSTNDYSIFVRDMNLVSWNQSEHKLAVNGEGETEIYIVVSDKMTIVPVKVGRSKAVLSLAFPEELVSLTGIMEKSAKRQNASNATRPRRTLSLQTSIAEAEKTLSTLQKKQERFYLEAKEVVFKRVSIQIIDDRSDEKKGEIYPVSGVKIRTLGTEYQARTDAKGLVHLEDVPAGGRLIVLVDDDRGMIRPGIGEIQASEDALDEVVRIRVLRESSYNILSMVYDVAQRSDHGSFCVQLHNTGDAKAVEGIEARLNIEADGPYYFGQFGPEKNRLATNSKGKFCFFNVGPGLAEVLLFKEQQFESALAISVLTGRHLDEIFEVSEEAVFSTRLGVASGVHQQVYGSIAEANALESTDFVEMIRIGDNAVMEALDYGVVGSEDLVGVYQGQLYGLVRAPEFETTLYAYSPAAVERERNYVTPLLKRGFIEDLFQELAATQQGIGASYFDPTLGSLIVQYGQLAGQTSNISIRLVNEFGQKIEDGWYYGVEGDLLTKGVFFNLEPGIYMVIVETEDHFWIDARPIAVDYSTTSVALLGSRIRFNDSQQQ